MAYSFEPMSHLHRNAVIDIFNHFVTNSFAAFLEEPLPYEAFARFLEMARGYPSLVAREAGTGQVVGFAFLRAFHPAATFLRTAEVTNFILPEHTRKGIGSALLGRLIEAAPARGIDCLLAAISSQNEQSLCFHRKQGFRECGRFLTVGRKLGEDFDVVWMQLRL
ncbi:MAG: N-acetyltransferase family protein [bacterium]